MAYTSFKIVFGHALSSEEIKQDFTLKNLQGLLPALIDENKVYVASREYHETYWIGALLGEMDDLMPYTKIQNFVVSDAHHEDLEDMIDALPVSVQKTFTQTPAQILLIPQWM